MGDYIDEVALDAKLTDWQVHVLREVLRVDSALKLYSIAAYFPTALAAYQLDVSVLSSVSAKQTSSEVRRQVERHRKIRPSRLRGAKCPPGVQIRPGHVVPLPARSSRDASGFGHDVPSLHAGSVDVDVGPRLPNVALDVGLNMSWPVRDQGERGTCVSFAVVACREHLIHTQSPEQLSEQYLYWAIKKHTGDKDENPGVEGTYLEFGRDALSGRGTCTATRWPYHPQFRDDNLTHEDDSNPSGEAHADAAVRAYDATEYSRRATASRIFELLRSGRATALTLPVFADPTSSDLDNWNAPVAVAYGAVLDPLPTSVAQEGHAVCVTGFVPDPQEAKGGYFVFRNSWGTDWAKLAAGAKSSHGPAPGYGTVSASYVERYGWELCGL